MSKLSKDEEIARNYISSYNVIIEKIDEEKFADNKVPDFKLTFNECICYA